MNSCISTNWFSRRNFGNQRFSLAVILAVGSASFARPAPVYGATTTYNVNSTLDNSDAGIDGVCDDGFGNCTLRAALEETNWTAGADQVRVTFAIPGGGPHAITLGSALPRIERNNSTIDGTTQSGASCGSLWSGIAPVWKIVIDVNWLPVVGLNFEADNATVRGLEIKNINGEATRSYAVRIRNNSVVQCSYLHHAWGGVFVVGNDNLVGGPNPGNGIVTNGHGLSGVTTYGDNNIIQGNFSGTDVSGFSSVPNDLGVYVELGHGNIVGGSTPGARNLLSGSRDKGIFIKEGCTATIIQNNYVGLARDGLSPLSNAGQGLLDKGTGTVIGGTTAGTGNVFASSTAFLTAAIELQANATVQGNFIGTNALGMAAVGNSIGILVSDASQNIIGGTTKFAKNVISGNEIGILLLSFDSPVTANIIQGNLIGVAKDGTTPLGNTDYGILLMGTGTSGNVIGGTSTGAGNIIANSSKAGISTADVLGGGFFSDAGAGNSFIRNSIYGNGTLGIDLVSAGIEGVTPNDAGDVDVGPNDFQNFPVLTRGTASANRTSVRGVLESTPLTAFRLDFYWSPSSQPTQAKTFLGSKDIRTDRRGRRRFVASRLLWMPEAGLITATATAPDGSTSELSAPFAPRLTGAFLRQ